MIPLPEEIKEKIKNDANEACQMPAFSGGTRLNDQRFLGYVDAATKYISDMEEFLEWAWEGYYQIQNKEWVPRKGNDAMPRTTSELIIEFYRLKNK